MFHRSLGKYSLHEKISESLIRKGETMKRYIRKKLIAAFLSVVLVLTFCAAPAVDKGIPTGTSVAYAATYQEQIDDKKDDLSGVKEEQKEVQNELAKVADDIKVLQANVDQINAQIGQTTQEISNTEAKIDDKKAEIRAKKAEIKKKQKEIQKQEEGLNERLVVMYKNGSVGFMDVLMGSNSISEFVSNVEMIQKIYENDVEILKILEKEHKKLEKQRKKLLEEEEALKAIQAELAKKKEQLNGQIAQLKEKQGELNSKKKVLEDKEDELKAAADKLIAEIKKLQDASRVYSGGAFQWPVPSSTYISSSFGYRIHPIFKTWKLHTGTDIGASYGVPIVAAAEGKVIMATWYGGYGNCVMIDHGSGIVTLYGHCSGYACSPGQEVKKGQTIAYVGSTGNSTGNHCHFEVRINGQYVNPMSYFS